MKKILILVFSLFLILNSSYAFNISDSSKNLRDYFSINNPVVFIETNLNLSNYSINYTINNHPISKILNLSQCSNNFCSSFSLLDFINVTNSTFSSGTKFILNFGNESKKIYLDIEKPIFNFLNYSINKSTKILTFNYSYSDNFNVSKIDLYEKKGNNLIFLKEIKNFTNSSLILNKLGNLTLIFKIFDIAKNTNELEQLIIIPDIFKPKILSSQIILENNNYKLNFSISDNSLLKYEVSQKNIILNEMISGKLFSKLLSLPFSSGIIKLSILDNNSNLKSINLSLKSPIINSFNSNTFSNVPVFKFTSNANSCSLISLDSNILNQHFTKSDNQFSLNLNLNSIKNYDLKISCEIPNYKEIFNSNFYYDTQNPSISNINIETLQSGFLKISWNKSYDTQSSITYKLFKNSNLIYSGNNLMYIDKKVSYPNSYSYRLKVEDLATNIVSSNKLSTIPKKVDLIFLASKNLDSGNIVENTFFNFKINTEKNINITILQKVEGKLILNNSLNTYNKTFLNYTLNLLNGINEISILGEDLFGNKKIITSSIIYNSNILNKITPKTNITNSIIVKQEISKKTISPNNLTSNLSNLNLNNTNNSSGSFFWIWIIFWIVILGIFIRAFILNEDKLKERLLKFQYSNKRKMNNFNLKRKKDTKLEMSLNKIKSNRFKKQEKIKFENQKKIEASKKVLSEFEKKKFKDLKEKSFKDISFSNTSRIISKRRVNKIKKNLNYNKDLKRKEIKSFYENISEKFNNLNFKSEKKEDEFLNYIQKKRSEKSWRNTQEYLLKTKLKKDEIENKKLHELENNKNRIILEKNKKLQEMGELEIKKNQKKIEKIKSNEDKKLAMASLNEYLGKKSKKRKLFFAERDVIFDLKNRKD